MKVLVSGGTGFIGSCLVRHLLAANYEIRVLAHHKKNRFLIEGLNVEIVDGDITNYKSVEKAVRGCSVVFNLASLYTFYPFWEKEAKEIYETNVKGTTNMLKAALNSKVNRFIHTSTVATIGKRGDGKLSDEHTQFDFKNASHYARSKYLAEKEVLKFCQKGLSAIILNPAIVIGERDYKPTPSGEMIVKFLNRRYPFYFDAVLCIADVDDVAKAHISAITNGRSGQRYILCNQKAYTLKEIFNLLKEISGIRVSQIKIPYPLLLSFLYLEEVMSYFFLNKKPLMPLEGAKFCNMSIRFDNSKAVEELHYRETPIRETLIKAVNWYKKEGYVKIE
jgi:dihydroflavonol-4-reductase